MDEHSAWLTQAQGDLEAGRRVLDPGDPSTHCQAVSKYQQAVEKGIKGLVVALSRSGFCSLPVGRGHGVYRFVVALRRSPRVRGSASTALPYALMRVFDNPRCEAIRALDDLVPSWPRPGHPFARNTEYPYNRADGSWTPPAASDAFSMAEVERFQRVAHEIVYEAKRLSSAALRAP